MKAAIAKEGESYNEVKPELDNRPFITKSRQDLFSGDLSFTSVLL